MDTLCTYTAIFGVGILVGASMRIKAFLNNVNDTIELKPLPKKPERKARE